MKRLVFSLLLGLAGASAPQDSELTWIFIRTAVRRTASFRRSNRQAQYRLTGAHSLVLQ